MKKETGTSEIMKMVTLTTLTKLIRNIIAFH